MSAPRSDRLIIDLTMLVLVEICLAYALTGNDAHEIFGVALVLLFAIHNALNHRAYRSRLKRLGGRRRLVASGVILLLLASALTTAATGLLGSHLLAASDTADPLTRRIHVLAANWFLVFASVHLGLHWRTPAAGFSHFAPERASGRHYPFAPIALAAAFVAFGLISSERLNIPARLMGRYSFGYWDFDSEACLFFLLYTSIILMICSLTSVAMRLVEFLPDRLAPDHDRRPGDGNECIKAIHEIDS